MKKSLFCIAILTGVLGLTACESKDSDTLPAKTEITSETPTETETTVPEETEVVTETKNI